MQSTPLIPGERLAKRVHAVSRGVELKLTVPAAAGSLFRMCSARSLLLVRDSNGYVFGAFTPEGWHVGTRFFGTGETFVFQLKVPTNLHDSAACVALQAYNPPLAPVWASDV